MTDDDILLKSYEIADTAKNPMEYITRLQAYVVEAQGLEISRSAAEVAMATEAVELNAAAKRVSASAHVLLRFDGALNRTLAYHRTRYERPSAAALMFHKEFASG